MFYKKKKKIIDPMSLVHRTISIHKPKEEAKMAINHSTIQETTHLIIILKDILSGKE